MVVAFRLEVTVAVLVQLLWPFLALAFALERGNQLHQWRRVTAGKKRQPMGVKKEKSLTAHVLLIRMRRRRFFFFGMVALLF